jgi:hypothetical protein
MLLSLQYRQVDEIPSFLVRIILTDFLWLIIEMISFYES